MDTLEFKQSVTITTWDLEAQKNASIEHLNYTTEVSYKKGDVIHIEIQDKNDVFDFDDEYYNVKFSDESISKIPRWIVNLISS